MKFIEKNRKKIELITLVAIGLFIFAVFFRLHYFQSLSDGVHFKSDLRTHITFAVRGSGYSIFYRFMGLLIKLFGRTIPLSVLGGLLIVGTWLATAKLVCMLSGNMRYFKAAIISLPLLILTGIYVPFVYEYFFRQQLVTQPYHNITYYAMRLVAVLAMIVFLTMFDTYLEKIKRSHWVSLAILLALSTAIKPSFLYGFALTLLVFLIIDFFKTGFKKKPFIHIIIMGLVVILSLLIMLYQYMRLYGVASSGSSSIVLVWGARFIKYGFASTLLKILCGLSFPILVAAINRKTFTRFDKFSYVMFIIQVIISALFAEDGVRATHGNFSWGLYVGAYFMFIVALAKFTNNLSDKKKEGNIFTPYTIAGIVLLFAHIISGLVYFNIVMQGGMCVI